MFRRVWTVGVLVAATIAPLPAGAPPACASEAPQAVLVIDRGSEGGPLDPLCIRLDDEEVSGKHLIELAGAQYDLAYRFTEYEGEGTAVCMLANVGYEGDNCLEEGPKHWGYWRDDGPGGWESSPVGVDDTVVEDGDIEGWSWAKGADRPPPADFDDVCPDEEPPSPSPTPSKDVEPTPSPDVSPRRPRPSPSPSPSPTARPRPDRRLNAVPDVSVLRGELLSPSPSPSGLPADATREDDQQDDGFPVAGALALALTIAMAATAVFLVRRRTP